MKRIIRLFKLAKPWAKYLVTATMMLFLISGINLYTPFVTRQIISIMESENFQSSIGIIISLSLILLVCYAARAFFQFIKNYFSHVASWRLVNHLRCMLYDHFQGLSMRYYHDKQTGQLMSRVISDTSTVENLIAHAIPDLFTNAITLIGVLAIMAFINPYLTLLVCIPMPFILTLSIVLRKIRRNFRKGQQKIAELSAVLQDNFSGMKEIQVFNKQEHESERIAEKSQEHAAALIKALFYSGILHPAVNFISSIGTIIVLIAGPVIALNSGLKISDIVAFLLYLNLLYTPISTLARVVEDVQQALAGAERVFEVLDTESEIKDKPGAQSVGRLAGEIQFDNVCFSYKSDIPVLKDISFHIRAGEMVALVGPTGVGKTTISALIPRFYDVDSGSISINGINITDMTLESLRNQLSIVLQDVFLFNGTIAENIAYGCDAPSQAEIEDAARTACIHDYINSLPEKYETVIGERGVRLSGGQKQRISIARAVLRNTPILILDEATSSVDTETETEIQKSINKIAGTRTLLVIAHRLSTVKRADNIIVLENGRIAEQGKHDELLKKQGVYAKLCSIQGLD